MDDKHNLSLFLILIIVALIPQFIIYNTLPVILLNDSVWYLDLTRYFAAGEFFPDYYAALKPIQCMINYPLGYPLFLDFCRLWAPTLYWGKAIVIFQHLLSLGSVLLLFYIGLRIGRRMEGFCAALVYALYLPRLIYAQAIMAESLCIFLTLLSLYLFFGILLNGGSWKKGLLLGVVTAFSILTKPLALLAAGVFIIYLLITPAGRKAFISFASSLAIIILANFLHNWHYYGEFVLTTTSGSHLANRVIAYDGLVDYHNSETKKILTLCYKSGVPYRFPGAWWDYLRALRSSGLSAQEADHLMMKASIAGIKSKPLVYIQRTFLAFQKNLVGEDFWIDTPAFLTKRDYFHYLHDWSSYPGGILPLAEYQSRQKVLHNMTVDYPVNPWHDFGVQWINVFENKLLKWRGWMGVFFIYAFIYGLMYRDKVLFFLTLFVMANLLFVSMAEAPFPRYFESFIPIAMLAVFLSFSISLKRIYD